MISSEEEGEIDTACVIKSNGETWNHTIIRKIGEGTFGKVYLSTCNDIKYALKTITHINSTNGIPLTTIREIKILRSLEHGNIIQLCDIAVKNYRPKNFEKQTCEIYFVFPFINSDLQFLLKRMDLKVGEIQFIAKQIAQGLKYLKMNNILHRDLKTANILVDNNFEIKIADFGLAKRVGDNGQNTPGLVTLWYRPPELLLGSREYDYSVDMWGFGCIVGEMITKTPIFKGATEITQLEIIIYNCGTINESTFKGVTGLTDFLKFKLPQSVKNLNKKFLNCDPSLVSLINNLLVLDPKERITCENVLTHQFITKKLKRRDIFEPFEENPKRLCQNKDLAVTPDNHINI